ncbi:pyridoxal-phosphate-dependent aminotransferase family protein [Clostridium cylindrosporum]|uniref:Aminotransferase, class V n=1 Tax=Clostridium cylindrosporum DSM 605 TaxID=1121307 RepID=A0A0J8G6S0_CLOCY|nr:alanine--glyoxylate aminotransferase family protein [Clostridium cylindrosporum]KMT23296.1 aminotransferase, class V [Clostridium cylindrosporum DSM 605]
MRVPLIMTPGPTQVRENVRMARSIECTNPDIDINFKNFYIETCYRIAKFLKTKNLVAVLSGEGILGLEAACASLTEKGDRVLVLDNGVYGGGFKDFAEMYGGEAVVLKSDEKKAFDVDKLKAFLEKDSNFKYATLVHCDTPSGVLNDASTICPLLKEYGIITVVDSVAAMGGEELKVDEWKIDIAIGGSQKAISAPAGLTLLSISDDAFSSMESRKTPIAGFYCNLLMWKNYKENAWFPYTMPISDIYGLRAAIDNILEEEDILIRHEKIASAVRDALKEVGVKLYLESGFSNTVTAIELDSKIHDKTLRDNLAKNYNLLIGGSVAYLEGKVIRIGHMGENAKAQHIIYTLTALQREFEAFGVKLNGNLTQAFINKLNS